MIKTIGSSSDPDLVEQLVKEGETWIKDKIGQKELDFTSERDFTETILENIEQITVAGTSLLLGKIFDEIGFDAIDDELFKQLVIARLCFPASKLKTTDFLSKYHFLSVEAQHIYRYMDKLHNSQKELVQDISYAHSLKVLNNEISVVFYDVTTLYFEVDHEDEIRKTGFSKEGKHQNPQILLGLLVSVDGYPLAYEIFEGNKYEGHTMLPVIDGFKNRYNIDQLIVVADSGLLTSTNIQELCAKGYEFILGARIKNETTDIKSQILSFDYSQTKEQLIVKQDGIRLLVTYSEKRAQKDKHNREKGLAKLEKKIKSGKLTKSNINNRGYNKYLKMDGEISLTIDREKFNSDGKWDGLKGYLTNTELSNKEIMESYAQLWKIEKAFRISKHDLKIRPVFHRIKRRIEAHICISFVAYKIYKELERQLKIKSSNLSPEKAIDIAKTIYAIQVKTPNQQHLITKTILITQEQKMLAKMFNF
ncbi:IS1634 family transposase [Draconibacterium sp.]|uniref:IS1634 family transposase n=1 Tax=Draconibacterium sp. TaxID=1965318 RepID=UPI003562CBB3